MPRNTQRRDLQPAEKGGYSNGKSAPRDGGLRGWVAVFATWTTWLIWGGLVKGLGVLLPTLKDQFVSRTWVIGWIIAMMTGSVGLSGVLAGPLGRRFGTGLVIIVSGVMVGGGFIVMAFVSSAVQLALLLTVVAGTGLGFANILTREAVGKCFTENYAMASAISQTGLSVAMFVSAPATQLLLDTYGWRATFILLGGFSMHLVNLGQLLRRTLPQEKRREYDLLPTDGSVNDKTSGAQQGRMAQLRNGCFELYRSSVQNLDLELFTDVKFWLILTMALCTFFSFDMWYIYFISHAQSKGFTPTDAAVFVTYAGIGNIVFKVAHAPVVDRGIIGMRSMIATNLLLSFASLILTPWINTYWSMAAGAFVYIASVGVIANLYDVIVKEIFSQDRMACAFGWIGITIGVFRVVLGFFPGWIYDQTGSYDLAFLIFGGLQLIGLAALMCLRCMEKPR